jgi:hypothetical protein
MNRIKSEDKLKCIQEREYPLMGSVLETSFFTIQNEPEKIIAIRQETFADTPSLSISSPSYLRDLLPNPEITPFVLPKLLSVDAGLKIQFSKPPGLNFSIGKISFEALLNGTCVAYCFVSPTSMSQLSKDALLNVHITPVALSNPISGPLNTIQSILHGALIGTVNGMLYGNWAAESSMVGLQKIQILDEKGKSLCWLDELLDGIEFEYDIDAVRTIGQCAFERTTDFNNALKQFYSGVWM